MPFTSHKAINTVENSAASMASESCQSEQDTKQNTPHNKIPHWYVEGEKLIVSWDGPKDPANPRNWSKRRRWIITAVVSSLTFTSALPSSMIAPGIEQISEEFAIRNSVISAMVTSVFVLSFAVGPLVIGPLSEIFGRKPVMVFSSVWFLLWNLASEFAQATSQIIVFRFLAGLGSSVHINIGIAILGDMWSKEERGRVVSTYNLMPSLSPIVGPLIGSWIVEKTKWRWVFWSLSIWQCVVMPGLFYLSETYPPVLLERKAEGIKERLSDLSNGGTSLEAEFHLNKPIVLIQTIYGDKERSWKTIFAEALTRPFALSFREPIIQVMGLYLAFVYGMLYFLLTTVPTTFKYTYGQSLGISGLNYIAMGVGIAFASQLNANTMNTLYMHLKNRYGCTKPEFRLPPMVPASLFLPLGLLLTGWATQKHLHWVIADVGLFLFGMGWTINFQCIHVYVVDAFTLYSAPALAAVTWLRSLAGFAFPLFAPVMYDKLGYGIGNTILACVGIAIGCPAPILLWIYGERIREVSKYTNK